MVRGVTVRWSHAAHLYGGLIFRFQGVPTCGPAREPRLSANGLLPLLLDWRKRNRVCAVIEFANWSWRVVKKGVWLLGIVPQLLDWISIYVPAESTPSGIRSLLEAGGSWSVTFILAGLGLFVSVFLVHLDDKRVVAESERKIGEIEAKQPRLVVGLQDENGQPVRTLRIQLSSLPAKPEYDAALEKERERLLAKRRDYLSPGDVAAAVGRSLLGGGNPHYDEELERYLAEYRNYLVRKHERGLVADRTRAFTLAVRNEGYRPANNLSIELAMPPKYGRPAEHQLHKPLIGAEEAEEVGLTVDELRELDDAHVCRRPSEPELTTSQLGALSFFDAIRPSPPWLEAAGLPAALNPDAPTHDERAGTHFITYHVDQLVQHRRQWVFEPFFAWLGDADDSTAWEIQVKITCAELYEPVQQTLLLDISILKDD